MKISTEDAWACDACDSEGDFLIDTGSFTLDLCRKHLFQLRALIEDLETNEAPRDR